MIEAVEQWAWVYRFVAAQGDGVRVEYPRRSLPHPREAGAEVSVGWPAGQIADYRFPPDSDCQGLHVHEFADRWIVHIDQVHPECDLGEHIRRDAPAVAYLGGAMAGAALGAAVSKKSGGALVGAGLGLLVAALLISHDE
jgi:hypothetical protein